MHNENEVRLGIVFGRYYFSETKNGEKEFGIIYGRGLTYDRNTFIKFIAFNNLKDLKNFGKQNEITTFKNSFLNKH